MADEPTPALQVEQPPQADPKPSVSPAPASKPEQTPEQKQENYWRRKAEEAENEAQRLRAEKQERERAEMTEAERLRAERDDAEKARLAMERKLARLEAISAAELPRELADLVPDLPPDQVASFIEEKIKPLAEKFKSVPGPIGQSTQPPQAPTLPTESALARFERMEEGPEKDEFYKANREQILADYQMRNREMEARIR